jgi:diketogulonate reductase-like aldo/keto reductase
MVLGKVLGVVPGEAPGCVLCAVESGMVSKIGYRPGVAITVFFMRSCKLPSGAAMPVLGLGTWRMGESGRRRADELDALKYGIEIGYPMIDTAEMYGEGAAEEIVGEAIRGLAKLPYIVSKVYPHNATRAGTLAACERSLKRMGLECIDLYLLHWRGGARLEETFEAFHRLREAGKIADFGVSNFDRDDMADAARLDRGLLGSNQVLYCLSRRGPEFDLLPWMRRRSIPLMAYSPLDQGGLVAKPALKKLADGIGCTPAQLAIAWLLAQPGIVTIPKSSSRARVKENFAALDVTLTPEIAAGLDRLFPPPKGKQPLEML